MICATCGADNPSGSVYCGNCGSRLVPREDASMAKEQAAPATPPAGPDAPASVEDTPTLRTVPPVQEPAAATIADENVPTISIKPEQQVPPIPETPQPTPVASEFYNFEGPGGTPGIEAGQPAPVSGFASGTYPPVAAPTPAYPPAPAPGVASPSGTYPPVAAPTPGFPPAYPPTPTPGLAYSSGFYPAPTPQVGSPVSGVYGPLYQSQPSQPGWGAYPGTPGVFPQATPQGPSKLIRPLPTWAFITSILVVAIVLAALVFFTGADWAAGYQTAGLVALVVGVLVLIAFGVRAALGMLAATNPHRRSQIISAILLALLLFVFGAVGLTQPTAIHAVQAHFLESQQKYSAAIQEYEAAGQSAPSSEDIARTYDEWGESLVSQNQYNSAIGKFNTVMSSYTQAIPEVTRAEKDAVSAYEAWGTYDSQHQNYAGATQHYDALLNQTYCDSTCRTQANNADAVAYYNLAEQLLHKGQYASAVAAFNQLTTRFGDSSSAQKAHADYAAALWGEGQQQLTSACSSAVSTYQQLATQFSDTSQGQEAATALKAPVEVKGHFTTTVPAASTQPVVILGTSDMTNNTTIDQFTALYTASPHTQINSDGTFDLPSVKPGSYQFIWGTLNDPDGFIRVAWLPNHVAIGALCTYDFGDIPQTIPS